MRILGTGSSHCSSAPCVGEQAEFLSLLAIFSFLQEAQLLTRYMKQEVFLLSFSSALGTLNEKSGSELINNMKLKVS